MPRVIEVIVSPMGETTLQTKGYSGADCQQAADHHEQAARHPDRMTMAFSVAGLIAQGETEIKDAECVAVSFPEFFELLESVVER